MNYRWVSLAWLIAMLGLAGLAACLLLRRHPVPVSLPTASAAVPRVAARTSGHSDVQAIQALPPYRQAQKACRKGRFQQAADLLAHLSRTPGLSEEQQAFCQEQQQICLRHLSTADAAHSVNGKSGSHSPIPDTQNPTPAGSADCGPRALLLACRQLGVPASLPALSKAAGLSSKGVNFEGLKRASASVGIKAEGVQVSREALPDVTVPAIAWTNGRHFVEILHFSGRGESGTVTIHDPNKPQPETLQQEQLLQESGGYLLLLRK